MNRLRALLALTLLLLWAPDLGTQQQPLRVHFIDVGQGDAVLIQSPSGQNVLYDGGEDPVRVRDYLVAQGISEVGLVIASHNHADHIGGLAEVLRAFRPQFYMDNGIPATTLTYARVLEAVAAAGSQLLEPTTRRITLGDVSLLIVPPPGLPAWDQNDNSIGVVVEYGTFRLSLAGDAEPREWAWWNVHNREWMTPVHVHKASHHGSINGDTAAGLSSLSPKVVIVSAGLGNSYGHPDAEALRLYADAGATVYRTDTNGTVVVEAQASGTYTVRVERGEGAQPPTAPTPAPAPTPSTYRLSGVVQDASNALGLADVAVRISDGVNANRSTTTNSAGTYSLSNLESGGFTVGFSKSGYTTASRAVTLAQNTTLSLSLSRTVSTPIPTPRQRVGATCRDGTSSQATGSGACSSHGGVLCWRYSDGSCTNP